jgi:ankyrin repeat protein
MSLWKKVFGGKEDPAAVQKADLLRKAVAAGDTARVTAILTENPGLVSYRTGDDTATALHEAARSGARAVAELLLVGGADVNAKNKHGWTPLHEAAHYGRKDVAEILLANKAAVDAKDNDGKTPLRLTAVGGHKAVAELLLASKADVNSKDKQGLTPLHSAAGSKKDLAELLLANHAEVNVRSEAGLTPLHIAAFHGSQIMAELLIARKADINAKNKEGSTALRMSVQKGHKAVEELLLAKGATAGCSSCGSEKFTNVSLQDLEKHCRFSGTPKMCQSCRRVFLDSSVLLDDNRTIQSLDGLVKDATRGGQLRLPPTIFLKAEPNPPRTAIYRCVLGRAYHSEAGREFLQNLLLFCILARNTLVNGRIAERLIIEIDGYSEDKREIWQIPELASFFYMLHNQVQFPALEFWLTSDSLKVFIKAAVAGIPQDQKKTILQLSAAIAEVMPGMLKDGGSEEIQLMRWLLTEARAKTEAFWKKAKWEEDKVERLMSESELTKMLFGMLPAGSSDPRKKV